MRKKIVIVLCFLVGLGMILFPIITNHLNNIVHYTVIEEYKSEVEAIDGAELEKRKQEAIEYNHALTEYVTPISDPFSVESENKDKISEYATIMNVGQAMGYIDIPILNIELPIYKGVSDTVLSQGIGHIPSSSLPVGGKGTHASLTGHRGLPTSNLFRHLDKMDIGDEFYIHTLDETLAYQVDQITIVLPHEMDDLAIEPNEDYVTLITCEPYMINTHRLLVRGTRIPFEEDEQVLNEEMEDDESDNKILLSGLIIIGVIIVGSITIYIVRKKGKE